MDGNHHHRHCAGGAPASVRSVFSGFTPENGTELWVTDGTAAGTRLLKDFQPGFDPVIGYPLSGAPDGLTPLPDGRVIFAAYADPASRSLWVTDGTEAGTLRLDAPVDPAPGFTYLEQYGPRALPDGQILFRGTDSAHGLELWVTDGTGEGTHLLADVAPGPDSSVPESMTLLGGDRFVFSALSPDPRSGLPLPERELFVSDGSAAGTHRLIDYVPGTDTPLDPTSFIALGDGRALFASDLPPPDADSAPPGKLFWVTDGTAGGTFRIPQVTIEGAFLWPRSMVQVEVGHVAFTVPGPDGRQLAWISDGTVEGTHPIADLPVTDSSSAGGSGDAIQVIAEGRMLLQVAGADGLQIWASDGTPEGTALIKDGLPGEAASFLRLEEGRMLFSVTDGDVYGEHHTGLWSTDGTAEGTALLGEFPDSTLSRFFGQAQMVEDGGWIFAADESRFGWALWRTDGTTAGTVELSGVNPEGGFEGGPVFFPALAQAEKAGGHGGHHDAVWA